MFRFTALNSSSLHATVLKDRSVTYQEGDGCFIDNTVLDKIPAAHGVYGILVAYSRQPLKQSEKSKWDLGVLLKLHVCQTIILPLQGKRSCDSKCGYTPWIYKAQSKAEVIDVYNKKENLHIRYLNCISRLGESSDGFIKQNVKGPDVVPHSVFQNWKETLNNNFVTGYNAPPIYKMMDNTY